MRSLLRTGFYRTILGATALSSAAAGDPYAPMIDLFAASEPGEVWPIHEDYLFTDTACTTPVTTVGQEVKGWLGAKYGIKFTQATGSRIPKYARQPAGGWTQECLYPEDFTNAAWVKTSCTIASGQADPDGGTSAFSLTTSASGVSNILQNIYRGTPSHTWSVLVKAGTVNRIIIGFFRPGGFSDNIFDLVSGTWVLTSVYATRAATNLGGGWWQISITYAGATSNDTPVHYFGPINNSGTSPFDTTVGNSIICYHPMRNVGLTRATYQKRTGLLDGPESGASVAALYFDGDADSMSTPTFDFTSCNEMTVWLLWDKYAKINNFSTVVGTSWDTGGFQIIDNDNANHWWFALVGSSQYERYLNQNLPPMSRTVVSAAFDISAGANSINVRVTDETDTTYTALTTGVGTTPGTGNFGSRPLYVGARDGGTGLEACGFLVGALIVLGRAPTGTEITDIEAAIEAVS